MALIICILMPRMTYGVSPLVLTAEQSEYNLASHGAYLEDPTSHLVLDAVRSTTYGGQWQPNQNEVLHFGTSSAVYWLKFDLRSGPSIAKQWLLEIAYSQLDKVDVYLIADERLVQQFYAGDAFPFDQRPIRHRHFLFPLQIPNESNVQVYIRIASTSPLLIPIKLWKEYAYTSKNQKAMLYEGLFFGVLVMVVVCGLAVFFAMADRTYLYFTAIVFGNLFMSLQRLGYAFRYIFPESTWLQGSADVIAFCLTHIFGALFAIEFLALKKEAKHWHIVFRSFAGVYCMFLIFIPFMPIAMHSPVIQFTSFLMWLSIPIVGIQRWVQGHKAARYYTVAHLFILLGGAATFLAINGSLPYNDLTENAMHSAILSMLFVLAYGLAVNIQDERKSKAVALHQRAKAQKEVIEAYQSNIKLKNDFLAAISHELRTPMNAIVGGLQIMQGAPLRYSASALDIIRSGAADMMRLVNDILTHAEIQSKALTIKTDNFPANPMLQSLHERYQRACEAKTLRLDWEISKTVPEWLSTDKEKVVVILAKLLDNAVKFTEQGFVSFTFTCDKEKVPWTLQATIQDSGIGIAEEDQMHIYEEFTQTDSGFQRRYGGLGIGLSICRQLIEGLHGEFSLESTVGEGSCFTVTFPVKPGEPIVEETKHLASAELQILVVEDNPTNQLVMTKMLKKLGYRSLIANHGEEALEIIDRETLSLILMDLQMPVMDGFTCTEAIRNRSDEKKQIPIIAVTANLMDADKEHCIRSGMNDFLKKPVKLKVLQSSLCNYVEYAKHR